MNIQEIIQVTGWVFAFLIACYLIPYQIRNGWGDAENKTKKVCDVCFRDIKLVNKVVKKLEEEAILTKQPNGEGEI